MTLRTRFYSDHPRQENAPKEGAVWIVDESTLNNSGEIVPMLMGWITNNQGDRKPFRRNFYQEEEFMDCFQHARWEAESMNLILFIPECHRERWEALNHDEEPDWIAGTSMAISTGEERPRSRLRLRRPPKGRRTKGASIKPSPATFAHILRKQAAEAAEWFVNRSEYSNP